jgi:transcription elongation GreA/GreB family factor
MQKENEKVEWKQLLKKEGVQLLQIRVATIEEAIQNSRDSANSDEKSSAGDKYETGRAMGQLDIDMNARQLQKCLEEIDLLQSIDVSKLYAQVRTGACVSTPEGFFFVGIGLGLLQVNGKAVIYLSPQAPLASELLGKKSGDHFRFKGKEVSISEIY